MPRVHRLPDATFPLNGTEIMILNQSSITTRGVQQVTKKAPVADVVGAMMVFHGAITDGVSTEAFPSVPTTVNFSGAFIDSDSFWSSDSPSLFVVPLAGMYLCGAQVNWSQTGTPPTVETWFIQLLRNNNDVVAFDIREQDAALQTMAYTMSGPFPFAIGDTLLLQVQSDPDSLELVASMWMTYQGALLPPPPVPPVAPVITSDSSDTMTEGIGTTFTVTATGSPTITFSQAGTLPTGITWTAPVLSGTPGAGTAGTYDETFTATNGAGSATQAFTLTVVPAPPAYLLYDQFIDADGTDLTTHTMDVGPGWTSFAGTWWIQSNSASLHTSASQNQIVSDAGVADVTVKVTYTPSAIYDGALTFNASDSSNFWILSPDAGDGNFRLFKIVSGFYIEAVFDSFPLTAGTPYDLTLVTSSDTITYYVDGTMIRQFSEVGRFNSTATLFGLRTGDDTNSSWNNFIVQN